MRILNNKIKANGLQEYFFYEENSCLTLLNLLKKEPIHDNQAIVTVQRTLPSAGMLLTSVLCTFAWHILATSLSFRPHSSVFVAKKMQVAATSFQDRELGTLSGEDRCT